MEHGTAPPSEHVTNYQGEEATMVVGFRMDQGPPLTEEATEAQKMKPLAPSHRPGKERGRV